MKLQIDDQVYAIEIERKRSNKNTYIRVKKDMTIKVTTNYFTSDKAIGKIIEENTNQIKRMIESQKIKNENNTGFFYLGKKYDIVYVKGQELMQAMENLGYEMVKYLPQEEQK